MTINKRIKQLRKEKKLNQRQLADMLGVTQSGISYMEQDGSTVSESSIKNICRTFNINETWLRTGEGEMLKNVSGNILDTLAEEYGLDEFGRTVIEKMVTMSENQWDALSSLITTVVTDLSKSSHRPDSKSNTLQTRNQIEHEAEEAAQKFKEQYISKRMQEVAGSLIPEELRQSVEEAERAYEKNLGIAPKTDLSVSNITDGTGIADKANLA